LRKPRKRIAPKRGSKAEARRFGARARITDLPVVSSLYRKNILLPFFRNIWFYPRVLLPHGGAFGQSPQTLERDAMDASDIDKAYDVALGRAKPRGPDLPTLGSSLTEAIPAGDGGYQARHSGESAE